MIDQLVYRVDVEEYQPLANNSEALPPFERNHAIYLSQAEVRLNRLEQFHGCEFPQFANELLVDGGAKTGVVQESCVLHEIVALCQLAVEVG